MNDRSSTAGAPQEEAPSTTRLPGAAERIRADLPNPTEMQYHLLVEQVHDYAIFLMNPEGIITHWGEGAVRIKEFSPEEVVGNHLRMLYPEGGAEDGTAEEHLKKAAAEGEYVGEGMRRGRNRGEEQRHGPQPWTCLRSGPAFGIAAIQGLDVEQSSVLPR